jgi:hypothetical protein
MTRAEELFNSIFHRALTRWAAIYSFREIARLGLSDATEKVYADQMQFLQEVFYGSEYADIFYDQQKAAEAVSIEKLAQTALITKIEGFQNSVEAASIVFGHSMLDDAVFKYCEVTALVAPADWQSVLEKKEVTLAELASSTYEELFAAKLEQFLYKDLEKQSLPRKLDHLFARCKPPKGFVCMKDYRYDRKRIDEIDQLRHEIVHGEGPMPTLSNAEEDLWYMYKTTFCLMPLVNQRYGLQLDPEYVRKMKEAESK